MAYSIKTPNERIYNVAVDTENATKSQILIDSQSSSTYLTGHFLGDSGRFFDFEMSGQFTYSGSKLDLNDVAGTFTRMAYSYQGELVSEESYTDGYNLSKFLTPDYYPYSLSLLGGNDYFEGSNKWSKEDNARGLAGNDRFIGNNGNDYFDGGEGFDSMVFNGNWQEYQVKTNQQIQSRSIANVKATGVIITDLIDNRDGTDEGIDVEQLIFKDQTVSTQVAGNAGQAYRVYKAAFNRDPMSGDTKGLGYWIAQIDKGMDLIEVAARFVDSNEFRTLYGTNPTNAQFLTKLYQNVLGRQPEATGYNWWLNELNTNPSKTKAKVLADFAESSENQAGVASLIGNGITYEPWVG